MSPIVPRRLYKYLPATGAFSLLSNGVFWYRCPLHPAINDPWDCRPDLLENLDLTETRQAYRDCLIKLLCDPTPPPKPYALPGALLQALRLRDREWTPKDVDIAFGDVIAESFSNWPQTISRVKEQMETVLRDIRILCLCENPNSDLMWQRYAAEEHGACIGFRYVSEIDNAIGAAQPVKYVESWPVIATPGEWARHILFLKGIPFGERARAGLCLKLNEWQHEREWRIILKPRPETKSDSDGVYRVTIDPSEVAEIILGAKLSQDEVRRFTELAQGRYSHARIAFINEVR